MGQRGVLGAVTTGVAAPTTHITEPPASSELPRVADPSPLRTAVRPWLPTALALVACLALLFAWQAAFFSEHHPVVDHVAYSDQAERLLDGQLTIPADADAPSWAVRFTAISDEGRVFKYLPGTAAIGAASLRLTGDVNAALAGALGLLVIATSGIGATLRWSPIRRATAAFLVGASPVVLSNDAVLLSYVPALALATTALWLVLLATGAGSRSGNESDAIDLTDSHGPPTALPRRALVQLAGAGLLLGFTLLVRQIEIVAWTGALAGWCLLRTNVAARQRVLRTAVLLAATAPGIALVLAVNRHTTGDALHLPFTLVSPDDGMGWGLRRVLPDDALERFGLADGLRTTPRASFDLLMWTLAGPALAVGAGVTLWVRRHSPVHRLLAVLGLVIPLAFLFHWANAHAVRAGFYTSVGPFYYLACVPPLVLLGVEGLSRLPRRAMVTGLVVVIVAQSLFLADHLRAQWDYGRSTAPPPVAAAPTGR